MIVNTPESNTSIPHSSATKKKRRSQSVFSSERTEGVTNFSRLPSALMACADQRLKMNGLDLLAQFPDNSIPLAFFDPQYRGVLKKLNYGNEGKSRQMGRVQLTQMTDETILDFIEEFGRTLTPSGHLMLWIDKFHLVEDVVRWFEKSCLLKVDLMTWDKARMGMGYRARHQCEYLLIMQKKPKRAKGIWCAHDIPDIWTERASRKGHAHAKPEKMQSALIASVLREGDFVVDVAAGGFSVMRSAHAVNRHFIGCDVEG